MSIKLQRSLEPPQRHPPANNQRHKFPDLTLFYKIINDRESRIRQVRVHRVLRNGVHPESEAVLADVERLGNDPRWLQFDFQHQLQDLKEEELALEVIARPIADFREGEITVIVIGDLDGN